jgi:hypothetical protein
MRVLSFILLLAVSGLFAGVCLTAAPVPGADKPTRASAKVTVEMLRGLLGKGHFSQEAQALRELLVSPPTAIYLTKFEKFFYHNWKDEGISVHYDEESKVANVFLYSEGHDGYRQYAGEMPAKLAFGDTPAEVRKKLGDPEGVVEGEGAVNAHWQYPSKGLWVNFSTSDTWDAEAKLVLVIIGQVEEAR